MKFLSIILSALIILVLIDPLYSLEIKDKNVYLVDARGDDGDLHLHRFSIHKNLTRHKIDVSIFEETQWNFDVTRWEKTMFGMEAGWRFFKYFYAAQTIQYTSEAILENLAINESAHTTDTTTKLALKIPFLKYFSLFVSEEYTFDIPEQKGSYCESLAEVAWHPVKNISLGFGWRHTDRIHEMDTDYASFFAELEF